MNSDLKSQEIEIDQDQPLSNPSKLEDRLESIFQKDEPIVALESSPSHQDPILQRPTEASSPATIEDTQQQDEVTDQKVRVVLTEDEIKTLDRSILIQKWAQQNRFIDSIEVHLNQLINDNQTIKSQVISLQEAKQKLTQDLQSLKRKEKVLTMKLSMKEQELRDQLNEQQMLNKSVIPSETQLRAMPVDPAVDLLFQRMKQEMDNSKARLEEMQNELSACKFTTDSNTGKRLMAKCKLLQQENEDLGQMISVGRVGKLEGELALQKKLTEDLKKNQAEMDGFLVELDEDFEGMQSTIYILQQQLKEAKEQLDKYQQPESMISLVTEEPTIHPQIKSSSSGDSKLSAEIPHLQKGDSGYAGNGSTESNSPPADDLTNRCSPLKRTRDQSDGRETTQVMNSQQQPEPNPGMISCQNDLKPVPDVTDSLIPIKRLRTEVSFDEGDEDDLLNHFTPACSPVSLVNINLKSATTESTLSLCESSAECTAVNNRCSQELPKLETTSSPSVIKPNGLSKVPSAETIE